MESARYIAVDGPIGVGKTTLAEILARRLGARLVREPDDNPFLPAFYQEAFEHQPNDAALAGGHLTRHGIGDLGLAAMVFAAVTVAGIHDEALAEPGCS